MEIPESVIEKCEGLGYKVKSPRANAACVGKHILEGKSENEAKDVCTKEQLNHLAIYGCVAKHGV